MKSLLITPAKLKGNIKAPPSKSLSHRAIICSSLCNDGDSIIENIILSEDIKATIESMRTLGSDIRIFENEKNEKYLKIKRTNNNIKEALINCRESGSTLRFLIPIAMNLAEKCTFYGSGKLIERPLDTYYRIFEQQNISYSTVYGNLPLSICGKLSGGYYEICGSISSQFISGLFFTLPLLQNDSVIKIVDNLESRGYVDLTLDMLRKYNIHIVNNSYKEFKIYGNSQYKSVNYRVEGDYSQGAFFLVSKELGNNVECDGLNINSLQGDKEIVSIIDKYKNAKEEIVIDVSQIPDLVPILTVLASLKPGMITKIVNAGRLRMKESDRLKAISTEMNKLGADIQEFNDSLIIKGQKQLKGNAKVNSWNDHRIAMALAIASTCCEKEIILENYTAVNKSYPGFWEDYESLGGLIYEFNVGQ